MSCFCHNKKQGNATTVTLSYHRVERQIAHTLANVWLNGILLGNYRKTGIKNSSIHE